MRRLGPRADRTPAPERRTVRVPRSIGPPIAVSPSLLREQQRARGRPLELAGPNVSPSRPVALRLPTAIATRAPTAASIAPAPRIPRGEDRDPSVETISSVGPLPRIVPDSRPPLTYVSDLRPSRVATVEGSVHELEAAREVEIRGGGTKKVRNAKLKDATGEISLVLWGTEVDLVQEGDRIRITEGWVSDYRGRPQISLGRTGRLEKLTEGVP